MTPLERAEGLFVSCDFEAAAEVCRGELSKHQLLQKEVGDAATSTTAKALGGLAVQEEKGLLLRVCDMFVSPVTPCSQEDFLCALLLQCGYELQRKEHYEYCRDYYRRRGAMPFDVAMIWLKLRIAEGGVDEWLPQTLRHVLERLRALVKGVARKQEEAVNGPEEGFDLEEEEVLLRGYYDEVLELLLMNCMLPAGQVEEARGLLATDDVLPEERLSRLGAMCGRCDRQLRRGSERLEQQQQQHRGEQGIKAGGTASGRRKQSDRRRGWAPQQRTAGGEQGDEECKGQGAQGQSNGQGLTAAAALVAVGIIAIVAIRKRGVFGRIARAVCELGGIG